MGVGVPRPEASFHGFGPVFVSICPESLAGGTLHSKPELIFKTDVKKMKSVADDVLFSILFPPVSLLFSQKIQSSLGLLNEIWG